MTGGRRAVFLDRDGVLNERPPKHEYLTSLQAFRWLPGAREAVGRLAAAGWVLAVVSNQRGISRGLVSQEAIEAIDGELRAAGVAAAYYCPHGLDDGCDCRKPRPGLLLRAAADLGIEPAASWMIGDDETDVAAGRSAGCRTILLAPAGTASAADVVVPELVSAVQTVLAAVSATA